MSAMFCRSCCVVPLLSVMLGISCFAFWVLMPLIRFKPLYSAKICAICARRVNRLIARISFLMFLLSRLLVAESVLAVSRRCCMRHVSSLLVDRVCVCSAGTVECLSVLHRGFDGLLDALATAECCLVAIDHVCWRCSCSFVWVSGVLEVCARQCCEVVGLCDQILGRWLSWTRSLLSFSKTAC